MQRTVTYQTETRYRISRARENSYSDKINRIEAFDQKRSLALKGISCNIISPIRAARFNEQDY